MAASLYRDDDEVGITDINITPFVDVVLVLLVIFIVTAKLIVAHGVEIERPHEPVGTTVATSLVVTIDKDGAMYVDNEKLADEDVAVARISAIADAKNQRKVLIESDTHASYGQVMRAIAACRRAGITAIALESDRARM